MGWKRLLRWRCGLGYKPQHGFVRLQVLRYTTAAVTTTRGCVSPCRVVASTSLCPRAL